MRTFIFVVLVAVTSGFSQVGSFWFKTKKERDEFSFSYPNVYSVLDGSFEQIEQLQGSGKTVSSGDDDEVVAMTNVLRAYRALQKFVAENSPAQINRKCLESGIVDANADSCKKLVDQVSAFLVKNNITETQTSAAVSSKGEVNSEEILSLLNRISK
jgi:hypothetical protein